MLLQGLVPIPSGVQDLSVVYSPTPAMAPDAIIPMVQNVSDDPVKLLIRAFVIESTRDGFTVHLETPPDTDNYFLSWIASTAPEITQLVLTGRKMTDFPRQTQMPAPDDLLLLVTKSPFPVSRGLPWSVVYNSLLRRVNTVPADPTAAGSLGEVMIAPDGYVYFHTGALWGRTKLRTDNWNVQDTTTQEQFGTTDIAVAVTEVKITFPAEFVTPPTVFLNFRNEVSAEKVMLSALLGPVTTTDFTFYLNTPTPDANYKCIWQAKSA